MKTQSSSLATEDASLQDRMTQLQEKVVVFGRDVEEPPKQKDPFVPYNRKIIHNISCIIFTSSIISVITTITGIFLSVSTAFLENAIFSL